MGRAGLELALNAFWPLAGLYLLPSRNRQFPKVLSSVQGSFPVLLIKLWDTEAQARGHDWIESITLFVHLPAYKNACLDLSVLTVRDVQKRSDSEETEDR